MYIHAGCMCTHNLGCDLQKHYLISFETRSLIGLEVTNQVSTAWLVSSGNLLSLFSQHEDHKHVPPCCWIHYLFHGCDTSLNTA